MKRHGLFMFFAGCMTLQSAPVMAQTACNPLVSLDVNNVSLEKTLSALSAEYNFELTFPQGLGRTVSLSGQLPLDRLVEKLTKGSSTSLVYSEVPGCVQPQLAGVVVYQEGEEVAAGLPANTVEPLPVSEPPAVSGPQAPPEYINIDNMEQYVEDVFLSKRKPELARMTPEQQLEYRLARKKVKKFLEPQLKAGTLEREKRNKAADTAAETTSTTEQ